MTIRFNLSHHNLPSMSSSTTSLLADFRLSFGAVKSTTMTSLASGSTTLGVWTEPEVALLLFPVQHVTGHDVGLTTHSFGRSGCDSYRRTEVSVHSHIILFIINNCVIGKEHCMWPRLECVTKIACTTKLFATLRGDEKIIIQCLENVDLKWRKCGVQHVLARSWSLAYLLGYQILLPKCSIY